MGKGVLLELSGRQAVVLTPQGEFKRVPVPKGACDIGDEIEYAETQPAAWTRWGMVAAAAVVLLVAPYGYTSVLNAQPVAVVTVDINPSLQLTLNRKDQVLKAEALNPDGALVLDGVQWKRQPLNEVLQAVTSQAVAQQKLDPQSESSAVVVAVTPAGSKELPKEQADRIRDKAYDVVTTVAPAANVTALEASRAEKAEAEKVGLTVGKFLLYKELQEQNVPVTPEDLQRSGPGKVMKDLGINPGTIFKEAEKDHGGEPASKSKSKSDKGDSLLPALPVITQPGQPDDKGGGPKTDDKKADDKKADDKKADDKKADDKKADDTRADDKKADDKKADDKKTDDKKTDDKKTDDKKSDDKKSDAKTSEEKKEPDNKSGSDKGAGNQKNDTRKDDQKNGPGKDEHKKEEKKSSSWTVPFLGITIEKPAFLQGRDDQSASPAAEAPVPAAPRAEQPGVGAQPEATVPAGQDARQKVDEKEQRRPAEKQEEKQGEKPNKQEDWSGKGQAPGQSGDPKGKR